MMYTSTTNAQALMAPTVQMMINRSLLKSYYDQQKHSTTYYVNDGQEFQLEIRNTYTTRVLVKIKMNGQYLSDTGIVIDPFSYVILDRYIDSPNKFKYKTFVIDDVAETKGAQERNGLVEVEFYPEIIRPRITNTSSRLSSFVGNVKHGYEYDSLSTNINCSTSDVQSMNFCAQMKDLPDFNRGKDFAPGEAPKVETGRVSEGSRSNQTFEMTSGNFSSLYSALVSFQILPLSQKPVTIAKQHVAQVREYCSECGMRVRSTSWKFCAQCGNKI